MIGCVILNRQHEFMGTLRFAHPTGWQDGKIPFAELDACVKGWGNHVRFADTWGLRKTVFRRLAARKKRAANQ
jgi:hypothetical protein